MSLHWLWLFVPLVLAALWASNRPPENDEEPWGVNVIESPDKAFGPLVDVTQLSLTEKEREAFTKALLSHAKTISERR